MQALRNVRGDTGAYALIADIHGNFVALKETLDGMQDIGIKNLFIAGDFVGYYYRPDEAFLMLRDFKWQGVLGNHDRIFSEYKKASFAEKEAYIAKYGRALDVSLEKLGDTEKNPIRNLPERLEMTIVGKRVLMCHGLPWGDEERVYPDAPESTFGRIASLRFDFVVLGHTHYPFVERVGACTIINPGSVGQPRDEGGVASWAEVDFSGDAVILHRIAFDKSGVLEDAKNYESDYTYNRDVMVRKRKG